MAKEHPGFNALVTKGEGHRGGRREHPGFDALAHRGEGRGAAQADPIHIKPSHRGLLHEKLGVPQGEKIPKAKIEKAAHSNDPVLKKEAVFAENFGHKKK
jgi:hypothetical protein